MVVKDSVEVSFTHECIPCELAFPDKNLLIFHNQRKHNDKIRTKSNFRFASANNKSDHTKAPMINLRSKKLTIDKDFLDKSFSKIIYKKIFNKEVPKEDGNNTSINEEDDKQTTKYNMRKRKAANVPSVLPSKKQNISTSDLKPNSSDDEQRYKNQITKKVRVLLSKNIISKIVQTKELNLNEEISKSSLHSQVLSILQDPPLKETVPKSQEPPITAAVPKSPDSLVKETVPKYLDPLVKETVPEYLDPLVKETLPKYLDPLIKETVPKFHDPPNIPPLKSVQEPTIKDPENNTAGEEVNLCDPKSYTLPSSTLKNQIPNTAQQDQSEEECEVILLNPEKDDDVMEWQPSHDILPSNDMISEKEADVTVLNQSAAIEAGNKDGEGTDSEVVFLSENIFLPPLDCDEENPVLLKVKSESEAIETINTVFTALNNIVCEGSGSVLANGTDTHGLNTANNEKSNPDANKTADADATKVSNIISETEMNPLVNTRVVDRQCEIIELVETSNASITNPELEIIELDQTPSNRSNSNDNADLEIIELEEPPQNNPNSNQNTEGEIIELEEEVIEVVNDSLDPKESTETNHSSALTSIPESVVENSSNTAAAESSKDKNSGTGTDQCDISDLLEGDDEDENNKNNKKYDYNVNDIVWKLNYKGSKKEEKVKEDDLVNDGNIVANIFTIREEVKDKSHNRTFYCIEVPVDLPLYSENIVTRKVKPRFLRPCHSYIENEKILQSQAYRTDFKSLKRKLENVQNYRFNHDDLYEIPAEEKKTPLEYFGMDKYQQSLYLTHLRILKSRMSLESNVPSDQDVIEDKVIETVTIDDDTSLEEEDPTIKRLTKGLEESWPLSWMSKPEEISKLTEIMRKKISSERHELFMDPSQHKMEKRKISKLYTIANHSFWEIFGENKEAYDFKIQRELEENVFMKYINEKDTDSRLKELHKKWSWVCGKYVEMVLFPELFISWLQDRTQMKARENLETLFMTIGGPTQSDRDNFEEEVRLEIKKERTDGTDDDFKDEYDDYGDYDD